MPITQDGAAHKVGLTVKVQCHKLTVAADFGHTAYPLPNCPGVAASQNLYAKGTNVTVTAGESSDHVFLGWQETGNAFNPTLAAMDKDVKLTTSFRSKTMGEQITETVIDPALNAMGVAAKKAVGGIAYVTKIFAQHVIDDVFLSGLSLIGTGLAAGFDAIGVQGKVLDGIVLGLQTPSNAFEASLAGFDCVEEWAWGRSVPTLDDLEDTLKSAATGEAVAQVRGVPVDDVVAEAQAIAARIAAGDPEALTAGLRGGGRRWGRGDGPGPGQGHRGEPRPLGRSGRGAGELARVLRPDVPRGGVRQAVHLGDLRRRGLVDRRGRLPRLHGRERQGHGRPGR